MIRISRQHRSESIDTDLELNGYPGHGFDLSVSDYSENRQRTEENSMAEFMVVDLTFCCY